MSQTQLEIVVGLIVIGPMAVIGLAATAQTMWWQIQEEKQEEEAKRAAKQVPAD